MIGLIYLGIIFGYFWLSKFIVKEVYKITQSKTAKYIAIAVFVLIPTWDIILGYFVYKDLCKSKSGVHIYKTVDNVEGFYVGEKSKDREPHKPYKDYEYVDYKEKESGKYYRSHWIDNNTSKDCIPYKGAWDYEYTQAFERGKCIIKREILEKEVSRWSYDHNYTKTIKSKLFGITLETDRFIYDRKDKRYLTEKNSINWLGGWLGKYSTISFGSGRFEGHTCKSKPISIHKILKNKIAGEK